MRELDKSVNAKAAIEMAKREQDVEIARETTKAKEAEVQRAAQMAQLEKVRWEEQRRTLEAKRENEKVSTVIEGLDDPPADRILSNCAGGC